MRRMLHGASESSGILGTVTRVRACELPLAAHRGAAVLRIGEQRVHGAAEAGGEAHELGPREHAVARHVERVEKPVELLPYLLRVMEYVHAAAVDLGECTRFREFRVVCRASLVVLPSMTS